MRERVGRFGAGFSIGLFAQAHGASAGGFLDLGVADPLTQSIRSAAWVAVVGLALAIAAARHRLLVLAGLTAGFAAQALVLGRSTPTVVVGLASALLFLFELNTRNRAQHELDGSSDAILPREHHRGIELLSLVVAGLGVGVVLESLARHLRLFGGGLVHDERVFDASFLALVLVGALSFGWIARLPALRKLALPVMLAGAAAAGFVGLEVLDTLGSAQGLIPYLARFGLDTSWQGTLGFDALVAGSTYVVAAFLLGLAFVAARNPRALVATILGAALGPIVVVLLLGREHDNAGKTAEIYSAHLVSIGALIALGGALLALLSDLQRVPKARYVALALAALAAIPPLTIKPHPLFILSPWERRPIAPFVAFESAVGLVTLEHDRSMFKLATIDRRQLSPTAESTAADQGLLRDSFALLEPTKRSSRELRVLLLGQLTIVRAATLAHLGAARVDRTGGWYAEMPLLEREVFKEDAPPAGEILAPKEAGRRLASGAYDLVIALPVPGAPPALGDIDAPAATTVVRWIALDEPLWSGEEVHSTWTDGAARIERPAAILTGIGFERPSLGLVTNAFLSAPGSSDRPLVVDLDEMPTPPAPAAWLATRRLLRADRSRAAWADHLARRMASTPAANLLRSFAAFHVAQKLSSPFESHGQTLELPGQVLDDLRRQALEQPLDAFSRQAIEWLAGVLLEKRDVDGIQRTLAPIAAQHAPWLVLELALAHADLEGLDPAAAIARLTPLAAANTQYVELWRLLANAEELAGNKAEAIAAWNHAVQLEPTDRATRRNLAMARVRAEDPEGRALVEQLLRENDKDEGLRVFLGPGPYPPALYQHAGTSAHAGH